MTWLPGFRYDVFVSYARVDNATIDADPECGWVALFCRHLALALSRKVGRLDAVSIWLDVREVHGNQVFDRSIQEAINGSALFVALTSSGYLQSDYCRKELTWFIRKAQQDSVGLTIGDGHRVFRVSLDRVCRPEDLPEAGRTEGFRFYYPRGSKLEGEMVDAHPASEEFRVQLKGLTEAIHDTLQRLQDRLTPSERKARESIDRPLIYVADAADRRLRRRVVTELRDSNLVTVADDVPPPLEALDHDQAARTAIEAADLSVHLLGADPGREMDGRPEMYYTQRQVEIALDHGRSPLIWAPRDLAPESIDDRQHAAFLDRLENGPRAPSANYEFQRESPSAITRQVLAKVSQLRADRAGPAPADDATLLDMHPKDEPHVFELIRYLLGRNVKTVLNPQEEDPGRSLELFTERLKDVHILILCFGAVSEERVIARLTVAIQKVAAGYPLRACGVYVAPPRTASDIRSVPSSVVSVEWMDHTHGFDSGAVERLLMKGHGVGGGV